MAIMKANGRLNTGVVGLYQIPSGSLFFCECVEEKDGKIIFPTNKTARVKLVPRPEGGVDYGVDRADSFFGAPQFLRVSSVGVVVTDLTDPEILQSIRGVVSGLVVPPTR